MDAAPFEVRYECETSVDVEVTVQFDRALQLRPRRADARGGTVERGEGVQSAV